MIPLGVLLGCLLAWGVVPAAAQSYPTPQLVTGAFSAISLSQPSYLQTVAIPGLETSVVRITDQSTFGGGLDFYRHPYSKTQAWNSDETRLMVQSGDGATWYFLDGATYALLYTRTNVPQYFKWSNTNADRGWGISGVTLRQYTPSTGSFTNLATFSEFSAAFLGLQEGNLSDDDRYVPIIGTSGSDQVVVIWDLQAADEAGRLTFSGGGLDWASMSPSGTYVAVLVNGDLRVYTTGMTLIRTSAAQGSSGGGPIGHADLGYDTAGNEVLVYGESVPGEGEHFKTVRLSDDTITRQLHGSSQSPDTYMAANYHISCRNLARPGYAYISTYYTSGVTSYYLHREIFALKLDASGNVERYAQGFYASPPDAGFGNYWNAAMAVPNRNGTRVLFASDWGDGSSSAIVYDYVVGVPQSTAAPLVLRLVR